MAIISNLYPPIVSDTVPSFVRTTVCRIYFALSNYNSEEDIKNVQVSIINQRTNTSALDPKQYPSGILVCHGLPKNLDKEGDYRYYIEIPSSALITGIFGLNQFYKVQLRFTSRGASNLPAGNNGYVGPSAEWIYNNRAYFSEWSKVCLIKGIERPQITIHGLDDLAQDENNQEVVLTTEIVDIIGRMYYENNTQEKEYLKSYNIKIYQTQDLTNVVFDSEDIYTNPYNPNEINYELPYEFIDGIDYTLILNYTTNNLYTDSKKYRFVIIQRGLEELDNTILTTIADDENGRIIVNVRSAETFIGNLTFRRTSSKSDFHKWEDVKTVAIYTEADQDLNYTFYDTTIESGVWYKYGVQRRNGKGDRGVILKAENAVMCLLEDMYLTKKDCQLKIQLNPSLNEFKYNVTESQQVTIGSQFPYVKRNGNNYFRTFPIGGLISSFIDTTEWYHPHFEEKFFDPKQTYTQENRPKFSQEDFKNQKNEIKAFSSKNEILYKDSQDIQQLYTDYNNTHNINSYNDYIYEREFREKVYEFLYKHDVKLFRSTTEGNILVKLMNIDFHPVESLGRMLYSFTATAVEVDEANLKNYEKYGIQEIGTYETQFIYEHLVFGQVRSTFTISDKPYNIVKSVIEKKYKNKARKGYINTVKYLQWLRLEITSDPYVIIESSGGPKKADDSDNIINGASTFGYIIKINEKPIVIHPRIIRRTSDAVQTIKYEENNEQNPVTTMYIGYFELKEPNTQIYSLEFMEQTTATVDYIACLQQVENVEIIPNRYIYSQVQGQIFGTFQSGVDNSIYRKIGNKYRCYYDKFFYKELVAIIELKIESEPGAVIYITDSKDMEPGSLQYHPNRHVIQNGYLQLKDDEVYFKGTYFYGMHLIENKDSSSFIRKNEFVNINESAASTDEIPNPVKNGVYIINNKKKIYYNNDWYDFDDTNNDVKCPVDGSVNYYCEIVKGVY